MNCWFIDTSDDFYDKHWMYALAPVIRKYGGTCHYLHHSRIDRLPLEATLVLFKGMVCTKAATYAAAHRAREICTGSLVMGGPLSSVSDHRPIDLFDAVCVGEGEVAISDWIESGFKSGRNMATKANPSPDRAPLVDLSKTEMPYRDFHYHADWLMQKLPNRAFMAGRGCPYSCGYCFNHVFNSKFGLQIRRRPVDLLLEEIDCVRRRWGCQYVSFQDDTFIIDKKWFVEFCEKYPSKIGLPYTCNLRANLVTDEIALLLKRSGCTVASWSPECGSERLRNDWLNRRMDSQTILNCGNSLHNIGLKQRTSCIVGIPTETQDEVESTVQMNIACKSDNITMNIFVPWPGLDMTKKAIALRLLKSDTELPTTYYKESVFHGRSEYGVWLQKTTWLSNLFIVYPWTWRFRSQLHKIPAWILRIAHEILYGISMRNLYGLKMPLWVMLAVAWRQHVAMFSRRRG